MLMALICLRNGILDPTPGELPLDVFYLPDMSLQIPLKAASIRQKCRGIFIQKAANSP